MFYETEKKGLTNDSHVYHEDNFDKTYQQWKGKKSGFLSTFADFSVTEPRDLGANSSAIMENACWWLIGN